MSFQARVGLIVVILCGLLGGCTSVQRPRVEVASIQSGAVTDEGAVVHFTLLLVNPNDVELPVNKVSYRVTLGDDTFSFDASPAAAIPVYGEQTITLPAAFATRGRSLAGQPVTVAGQVHYQPPGKIREALTDMNIPLPHAPFASTATLE